ncbi:MAG: diguanylate cyclase domain-containing protein [Enterocloster sp.]
MISRGSGTLGCIYIDVNGLHEINNHLGHQAGDRMLKTISGHLPGIF